MLTNIYYFAFYLDHKRSFQDRNTLIQQSLDFLYPIKSCNRLYKISKNPNIKELSGNSAKSKINTNLLTRVLHSPFLAIFPWRLGPTYSTFCPVPNWPNLCRTFTTDNSSHFCNFSCTNVVTSLFTS
jgi:hypothetical protein